MPSQTIKNEDISVNELLNKDAKDIYPKYDDLSQDLSCQITHEVIKMKTTS